MIPVYQTLFFEPDRPVEKQRGNCLTACVASLLDLPIEAVPNFIQVDVAGGPNWWWHLHTYLKMMGVEIDGFKIRNPPINRHYIVTGLSARASEEYPIHHAVIYYNGKMVHDPFRDDPAGLLTTEHSYTFRPITVRH
jgi:hypothetical protein